MVIETVGGASLLHRVAARSICRATELANTTVDAAARITTTVIARLVLASGRQDSGWIFANQPL